MASSPTESPPSPPPESLSPPPPADSSLPPLPDSPPPPLDSSPPPPDFSPPPPEPDLSLPPPEASPSPPPPVDANSSPPLPVIDSSPLPTPPSLPPPRDSRSPPSPLPRQKAPMYGAPDAPPPPPPPRSLSVTPAAAESSGSGSMAPIVIAVIAGAGLLLVVTALVVMCFAKKKKKNNSDSYENGQANNNQPRHNWPQPASPSDHVVNIIPPPPGAISPSLGGWTAPPPPPPPPLIPSSSLHQIGSITRDALTITPTSSSFSGPSSSPLMPPPPTVALGFNKSTFMYDELALATGGFSQANLLGEGGFGFVHKGVLPNGKEIAVKSLKEGSAQGDKEFQAEVEIICRVHHRHLVSLVGHCISGAKKMLVYEFLPNNSLEFHLHKKGRRTILDWDSRLKIAIGSAKGLAYLHEDCHPRIIHRDIKTSNILLDFNFEAKVADFGLAKLNQDNFSHVSTRVMGTFGYLAPEYASSGKLTDKSDAFSFGVVLLELITGRSAVARTANHLEDSLVDWARPLCLKAIENGNFDALADPLLERNYNKIEMSRMVACAAASIRHSAKRRPKLSQIVRALEGDMSLKDLDHQEAGTSLNPTPNLYFQTTNSDTYESESYISKMRKFKSTLNSEEYGSSEYGATSEYGLDASSSSDDSSPDIIRKGIRSHSDP